MKKIYVLATVLLLIVFAIYFYPANLSKAKSDMIFIEDNDVKIFKALEFGITKQEFARQFMPPHNQITDQIWIWSDHDELIGKPTALFRRPSLDFYYIDWRESYKHIGSRSGQGDPNWDEGM